MNQIIAITFFVSEGFEAQSIASLLCKGWGFLFCLVLWFSTAGRYRSVQTACILKTGVQFQKLDSLIPSSRDSFRFS
jgi:hypothetical protein